jgi:hypothetical protein
VKGVAFHTKYRSFQPAKSDSVKIWPPVKNNG